MVIVNVLLFVIIPFILGCNPPDLIEGPDLEMLQCDYGQAYQSPNSRANPYCQPLDLQVSTAHHCHVLPDSSCSDLWRRDSRNRCEIPEIN